MCGKFTRLVAAGMALVSISTHALAQSRPITIDDVVGLETIGSVTIDPGGSWLVYERRGAFDAATDYDLGYRSVWTVSGLYALDLRHAGSPAPLLANPGPGGLIPGPWSPSGAHLLVYRLVDRKLEAGVVEMATRTVRWTGLTPDMPVAGAFAAWLDEDRLAMTVRPDASLPWVLRHDGDSQTEVARQWTTMAQGKTPSRTVVDTDSGVATTQNALVDQSVVIFDRTTNSIKPLLSGRVRDIAASPDGRAIAVLQGGAGIAADPSRPLIQSDIAERGDLVMIDVRTGALTRPVGDLDVAPHLLRWSPNSGSLLIWGRPYGADWAAGGLFQVRPDGSRIALRLDGLDPFPAGSGLDSLRGVRANLNGEQPVLYARQSGEDRFDWWGVSPEQPPVALTRDLVTPPARLAASTGHSLLMFADGGLWETQRGGLKRRSDPDQILADAGFTDMLAPLRLRINTPADRDWAVGVLANGEARTVGAGDVVGLSPGPAGGMTRIVAAGPSTIVSLTTDKGEQTLRLATALETRTVDHLNDELADRSWPRAIALAHKDRLGRDTQSYLYLPVGVAPRDVKGVIIAVYPGSVDDGAFQDPVTMRVSLSLELIAGAGYAVLSPAIPIDGEGSDTIDGYAQSVDVAVDTMLAAFAALPADRMAILGHSYGGYAALGIASRSHRYRSYVSWAGLSDLVGAWGEFTPISRSRPEEGSTVAYQMGWAEVGQGGTGGPPWAKPGVYLEKSPLFSADRITEPVMLITADRDFVPMSQAERIFSALHRQNRTSRLVTYWGEGHMMWSPANARDLYAQLFAWWDETLRPSGSSPLATADPPTLAPSPPAPPQS
ncbi:hypothetical protein KOAAANKH_00713 [Brevundimonas sp. NIBR10]|uniref:alpha/beta hydrolase family protein n=1 Tax=Brevundimonas sp. NIBR10 TaxID=3015997 RepID=UPI0022F1702D|nr:prolyl oligopeptidase family serine peptidase [Brevundimonas sp. NIBR10]WGM45849.1 hypothetical protein KOAAANKH_00713 [Brevundimonas sp. NIBR10]